MFANPVVAIAYGAPDSLIPMLGHRHGNEKSA